MAGFADSAEALVRVGYLGLIGEDTEIRIIRDALQGIYNSYFPRPGEAERTFARDFLCQQAGEEDAKKTQNMLEAIPFLCGCIHSRGMCAAVLRFYDLAEEVPMGDVRVLLIATYICRSSPPPTSRDDIGRFISSLDVTVEVRTVLSLSKLVLHI